MKELSIEQKAKAYDEAIKRGLDYIRQTPATEMVTRQSILEHIFPELAESEDERTWIINYLNNRKLNSSIIAEKENLKKAIAWLEKQGEQKPVEWSDEDEKILRGITAYVSTHACELEGFEKWYDWLQALKDRCLPQPKTEWNEKDKNHIDSIMQRLKGMCERGMTFTPTCYAVSEDISWLKFLRPQTTWKPSEEQLKALDDVFSYFPYNNYPHFIGVLKGLKEELKAL